MKNVLLTKHNKEYMKYNKILLCLVFVSLLFLPVLALPPMITEVNIIEDTIPYNGIAEFELEITNNQDVAEKIYIPQPRSAWIISLNKYIIELEPHESDIITIYALPQEDVKLGKYSLFLELKAMKNKEASTFQYFHVVIDSEKLSLVESTSLFGEVQAESIIEKSLLRKTHHVILTNVGLAKSEDYYYIEISDFDSFFLKAEPVYDEQLNSPEGKTMVWGYSLEPGESFEIFYSVSYIPLIVAGVLIFAAFIILLSFYRTPFSLEKEIIIHKKKELGEEGKNSIKIKLCIKNKTNKKQMNVIVRDKVPSPLRATGEFGTVEPTSIKKLKDKTELIWKFDILEPHEERIVTYEMKSSLKVLGKVLLPRAILEQKRNANKSLVMNSKITKFEF